jgi:hypothetical protein
VKTIREIDGIEIKDMTATMNQSTGKITQYRTAVKLSFGVEHSKYLNEKFGGQMTSIIAAMQDSLLLLESSKTGWKTHESLKGSHPPSKSKPCVFWDVR